MPRLDQHLRSLGLSAGAAREALRSGKVLLRGVPTSDGGRDVDPAEVQHRPDARRLTPGRDVVFLHRDEHLVVCWKPAGLLSVPAPRADGHRSVLGLVKTVCGSAFPVHRLDEETSGLLMVARTERAQLALKDLLERHEIERGYLALVKGRFPLAEQRLHSFLVRDRGDGLRGSAEGHPPRDAREATTRARAIEHLHQDASLVEARLETGRTHQVRIHLSERGHPVLGDPLYAPSSVARRAPRLALHAAILGLRHPITGQQLRWEAPLADDLEVLRRSLARPGQRVGRKPA